jgi:hypothetical protein
MINNPVQNQEKIIRIWAERREREIAVRIHYSVTIDNGCKIYQLRMVEELQ